MLIAGVMALAIPAGAPAASPVTNGSFESGDLTGWTTIIPPDAYVHVNAGGAPGQGSYYAQLKTDGPGSVTQLSQQFVATAGDEVTGWANYIDTEFGGAQPCRYVDPASVEILGPSNTVERVFYAQHCPSPGDDNGSTGWVQWTSAPLPADGTYTIRYRIENSLDSIYDGLVEGDGIAYIDNTPPAAACKLGVNPAGNPSPNPNAGFRQVTFSDNVGIASAVITGGTFTSGHLATGDYLKLTYDPDSAGSDVRPGPGVLAAHITTNGQPSLVVTDDAGNVTSVPCGPLPPTKQ